MRAAAARTKELTYKVRRASYRDMRSARWDHSVTQLPRQMLKDVTISVAVDVPVSLLCSSKVQPHEESPTMLLFGKSRRPSLTMPNVIKIARTVQKSVS